jgi:hypothetical protein
MIKQIGWNNNQQRIAPVAALELSDGCRRSEVVGSHSGEGAALGNA